MVMLSVSQGASAFASLPVEQGGGAACCDCTCERSDCCVEGSDSAESPIPALPFARVHVGFEFNVCWQAWLVSMEPSSEPLGSPVAFVEAASVRVPIYQFHCSYLI